MSKSTLILTFFLLLTACASTNYYAQVLQSWQGAPVQQLVQIWGPPDRIMQVPYSGSYYYIYSEQQYQNVPAPLTPALVPVAAPGQKPVLATAFLPGPSSVYLLQCTTWFQIGSNGRIVAVSYKGNDCFADREMSIHIANPV